MRSSRRYEIPGVVRKHANATTTRQFNDTADGPKLEVKTRSADMCAGAGDQHGIQCNWGKEGSVRLSERELSCVPKDHSIPFLSSEAVTTVFPSGAKAIELTTPSCPSKTATHFPSEGKRKENAEKRGKRQGNDGERDRERKRTRENERARER